MADSPLLTLPEMAERLRISVRTVQREVQLGHLRPVRIGRRVLFTEREADAYVAAAYRRSA